MSNLSDKKLTYGCWAFNSLLELDPTSALLADWLEHVVPQLEGSCLVTLLAEMEAVWSEEAEIVFALIVLQKIADIKLVLKL